MLKGWVRGRRSLKRVVKKGGTEREFSFSWPDGGSWPYLSQGLLPLAS